MIEVVFSDSAYGGLKAAQHYGEGKYSGGTFGVFVSRHDGSAPTEEEIEATRREFEKRERLEWERAVPMDGNPADVYGFSFGLSIGDISEDIPGEKRRQVLDWLYSIHPNMDDEPAFTDEMVQHGREVLEEVCGRISAGEEVRVWYSNQPDELCGLYWFMTQIDKLELRDNQVFLVALSDWETRGDGSIVIQSGWGGIKPGDFHKYVRSQIAAPHAFRKMCASCWEQLKEENAILRAVLNGRLVSVPEALYDDFITRVINAEENEFHEAMVIGKVLGKYELGIGDAWVVVHRIEKMISAGRLIPITEPAPGAPIYHRRLRKR